MQSSLRRLDIEFPWTPQTIVNEPFRVNVVPSKGSRNHKINIWTYVQSSLRHLASLQIFSLVCSICRTWAGMTMATLDYRQAAPCNSVTQSGRIWLVSLTALRVTPRGWGRVAAQNKRRLAPAPRPESRLPAFPGSGRSAVTIRLWSCGLLLLLSTHNLSGAGFIFHVYCSSECSECFLGNFELELWHCLKVDECWMLSHSPNSGLEIYTMFTPPLTLCLSLWLWEARLFTKLECHLHHQQ